MSTAGDVGAIAGAAGDLFGGFFEFKGKKAEAKAYKQAAAFALQNATLSQEAGEIKLAQAGRAIYKTLGAQQASVAAAGLTGGGTADALLRSSVSQGALEKAIVNEQTQINVTGYKSQAAQFAGMAASAKAAGKGGLLGGIFKAAVELAPLVL